MQRVTGIGGLFFRAKDPATLKSWYNTHLGVGPENPESRYDPWQQKAGDTAFEPFPLDAEKFGRPEQAWMINFRVSDIDAMVAQLRDAGIEVTLDPETYPWGRFAQLHDPEGNPIELWQPAPE